jgi:hypothetical protein
MKRAIEKKRPRGSAFPKARCRAGWRPGGNNSTNGWRGWHRHCPRLPGPLSSPKLRPPFPPLFSTKPFIWHSPG